MLTQKLSLQKVQALHKIRTLKVISLTGYFHRHRQNIIYLLCLVGALLVLWSWNPASGVPSTQKFNGRVMLVVGTCLLYMGLVVQGKQGIQPKPLLLATFHHGASLRYWVIAFLGGWALILLGFWLNHDYHFLGMRPPVQQALSNDKQIALFLGGIALWVLGFLREGDATRIIQHLQASLKNHRLEWLMVGGLTAAALAVRLYRLDTSIPILISDESAYLAAVQRVLRGDSLTIANDMHRGDLYLGAYLISFIVRFLGATLFTGRLLAAISGALAIPGVYLMARKIFNWQAGLLAGLFLIVQPLHMHFSRIAMYDIYDPTLGIFAVLLIWHGIEHGGYWKFALAGALIGFSLYFYAGAKLWLILIPAWLLVVGLRKPRLILSHLPNFVLLAVTIALILFPMIARFKVQNMDPFAHAETMGRGTQDGILHVLDDWTVKSFIFDGLSPSIRAFVDKGDVTRHFEPIGKVALNLRWALLAFALGIAFYLRHPFNEGLLFLILWLGLTVIFGGALMQDTPGFSRYVTATLPMAVLAGLGVAAFFHTFSDMLPKPNPSFVMLPALAFMLIVNVNDARYVYNNLPQNWMAEVFISRFTTESVVLDARSKINEGKTTYFLVTGEDADRFRLRETFLYFCADCTYRSLNLLVVDRSMYDLRWVTEAWLLTMKPEDDIYIYVLPEIDDPYDLDAPLSPRSLVPTIQAAFPDAEITRYNTAPFTTRQFALYTRVKIPAGAQYCPVGAACRK